MHPLVLAQRVLCAAPTYLETHGSPAHPTELRQHACLHYGHTTMGNYWKLIGSDGEHTVHTPSVLCSNNGEVLREAAIKGLGIALLPIFIVGNYLKQGTLRPVLPDYHPREIYVCIVYPAHRHLSTKIQLFTHFLKARFGDRSDWAEE